jgi:hypothetical protein
VLSVSEGALAVAAGVAASAVCGVTVAAGVAASAVCGLTVAAGVAAAAAEGVANCLRGWTDGRVG